MTVGIKYCGGCNPRWERGTAAARLREEIPETELVRAGERIADVIAVVCGCPVACAGHTELAGRYGKLVLTEESDCERLLAMVRAANPASPTADPTVPNTKV